VGKLVDSQGGDVEPTGVQWIPDRWIGEPVEVIHHIQQAGVLSVGPTAGVLEESDDLGMLLSVTDPQRGSVEHRFFPRATIVQIIAPIG
jgi:hypothetical protein